MELLVESCKSRAAFVVCCLWFGLKTREKFAVAINCEAMQCSDIPTKMRLLAMLGSGPSAQRSLTSNLAGIAATRPAVFER